MAIKAHSYRKASWSTLATAAFSLPAWPLGVPLLTGVICVVAIPLFAVLQIMAATADH